MVNPSTRKTETRKTKIQPPRRTLSIIQSKSINRPQIEEEQSQQQLNESTDFSEHECSICLSEFLVGDEIMCASGRQSCTHKFHKSCLLSWLETQNLCPMCRFEMVKDSELEEAMKATGITPLSDPNSV